MIASCTVTTAGVPRAEAVIGREVHHIQAIVAHGAPGEVVVEARVRAPPGRVADGHALPVGAQLEGAPVSAYRYTSCSAARPSKAGTKWAT